MAMNHIGTYALNCPAQSLIGCRIPNQTKAAENEIHESPFLRVHEERNHLVAGLLKHRAFFLDHAVLTATDHGIVVMYQKNLH